MKRVLSLVLSSLLVCSAVAFAGAPSATTTILTRGIQGPPGAAAISTTLQFATNMPAVGSSASFAVNSASGVAIGSNVTVAGLGTLLVTAIAGNNLTLQNTGATGNAAAGTQAAFGASVLLSGPPGPGGAAGPTGSAGATGATGAAGSTGATGANGGDSFTTTTSSFVQPGSGSTVTVSVVAGAWMVVGQTVYVASGGYYTVSSGGTTSVSLRNAGATGNASPAAVISGGSSIAPAGAQGATGATGAAGTSGFAAGGDLTGSSTSQQVQSLTGNATTGQVPFPVAATGPGLTQPSTTGATGANLTLSPQASTAANGTPGNVVINVPAPTGTGVAGGLAVTSGGAVTAQSGSVRLNATGSITSRNSFNTLDLNLLSNDGANDAIYGDYNLGSVVFRAGSSVLFGVGGGAYQMTLTSTKIQAMAPIVGDGASSPYGVHGDVSITMSANATLTAAQYAQNILRVAVTGGPFTLSGFPLAGAGNGYQKLIYSSNATSFSVSDGTHTASIPATIGLYVVAFTSVGIFVK